MKDRRILDYTTFKNESLISDVFNKVSKTLGGWASKFMDSLKNMKKIPSGPKKGLPVAMLFVKENGSIVEQMKDFLKLNLKTEAKVPLEYTGEDQSVRNIDVKDLVNDVKKLYISKTKGGRAKPIFIYGAPGIGKTQIVGQAADELGVSVLLLDLQFMSPEDFLGIPSTHEIRPVKVEDGIIKDKGLGFTRNNPPTKLPTDNGPEGKGGIIFMDEMNRANKVVIGSIMQFVQMGRIDEYRLPDKWVIVAAGNRPEEADVADFDFALADRFTIKNYVPKVEDWAEWASKNYRILPELVTFMKFNKDLFHHLDTDKKSMNYPTPRSWTDAALILKDELDYSNAESWRDLNKTEISNIFHDQVGSAAAGKFIAYLEILRKISERDFDEIINNPSKAMLITDARTQKSILYGLTEMLLNMVPSYNVTHLYNLMVYFVRYEELEILGWLYSSICKKYPEFKNVGIGSDNEKTMKTDAQKLIRNSANKKGLI